MSVTRYRCSCEELSISAESFYRIEQQERDVRDKWGSGKTSGCVALDAGPDIDNDSSSNTGADRTRIIMCSVAPGRYILARTACSTGLLCDGKN